MHDDSFLLTGREGGRPRFGVLMGVLLLVSAGLMVLSRLEHSYVRVLRGHLTDALAPALSMTAAAVAPLKTLAGRLGQQLDAAEDHERLKRELQELESWKRRAGELERRFGDLAHASRLVPEPVVPFVTARVVAMSTGTFTYSAIVAAGRSHGLKAGFPVVNADGLVGRIVDAGEASARLLLATDQASRIPVQVGASSVRAIMAGDGRGMPRLQHVGQGTEIKAGDAVVTSGVGGLFPRGLRVGEVIASGEGPRVRLHANTDALDYVIVMFFETPTLDLTDAASPARARRELAGKPPLAKPGEQP
ncbi:MAG: rod shape-determining protein MreC [Hyphomicrobiaceae bacterium]|nr:rod shape-determining protein MreC [Hyphomicrobiaceae bacterium]